MSFYNPYMKGPDIGGGMSDIVGQILQMLMMKRMFPQEQTSVGQTPLPMKQNPAGAMTSFSPATRPPVPQPGAMDNGAILQQIMMMLGGMPRF